MSMPFNSADAEWADQPVAAEPRPGLDPRRLAGLVTAAVERCQLDLRGKVVLTEAASGPYVLTPIIAACAGAARVYAMTKTTRYGTIEEVAAETLELARLTGIRERIELVVGRSPEIVAEADVITNSGHVRPIDADMICGMKPSAVVSLMYEAWKFRPGDVDLDACAERGIRVGATNERHPDVDVFSFLGPMAIKLLYDAEVAVYRSSILLLCDNPSGSFMTRALRRAGAHLDVARSVAEAPRDRPYDAIVVALKPRATPVLTAMDARIIAACWPGAVVAQYWGDIDRLALAEMDVPVWPERAPAAGHMGILPSALGPEPVVRLQAGGLKVGEILSRGTCDPAHDCLQAMDLDQITHW